MNRLNKNDNFIQEGINDPNNVLKVKILKPIGEAISLIEKGLNPEEKNLFGNYLDKTDLNNLISWYKKYKILYSYPTDKDRILSKNDENIINNIKKSKGKFDLMNLVEISIGSILETYFKEEVRIRKTTNYDDFKSGIDYIIEFLDENRKVSKIVGIDLTLSDDSLNLYYKQKKEKTIPKDYLKYIKTKQNTDFDFVPRLVLHIDRDLAYSITNNYFVQVLEKGDILSKEELEENFSYAVEDLKNILKKSPNTFGISREISNLVDETKQKAINLFLNN